MRRPPGGENMNDPERQERREEFERRRPMRDTTMVFTFIDEKQYINMDIPPDGSLGPAIAVDTSEGFYTYEFSIPLQKSQVRYFGIGAEPPRKIEVGAIWGEIDRAAMQQRGRGMHAGFGGEGPTEGGMPGDGGFGGGRGGGRFGGYGGGFHRPEIKKVDLWFKTTLAARQL